MSKTLSETMYSLLSREDHPGQVEYIREAERHADRLALGGVFLSDAHGAAIDAIAEAVDGPAIVEATAALEAADAQRPDPFPFTVDVACDRWTPSITAAYYLGLVIGLRAARALRGDDDAR